MHLAFTLLPQLFISHICIGKLNKLYVVICKNCILDITKILKKLQSVAYFDQFSPNMTVQNAYFSNMMQINV